MACNAHHGGIVGAELELRDENITTATPTEGLHLLTEIGVGAHATGNGDLAHTCSQQCLVKFFNQEINDGALDGGTKVGFVIFDEERVVLQTVAKEIEERGLDAAEAVVAIWD